MRFNKDDAEAQEFAVLPQGRYSFKVVKATDEVSRAGNEMIKLQLSIQGEDRVHCVFDYLVPKMAFKIKHFCDAIGKSGFFEKGELTADHCLGCEGLAEIGIDPAGNGYPEKNVVIDYVLSQEQIDAGNGQEKMPF